MRILLVDDEPLNLEVLQGFLAPEGYDLVLASDGEQALRLAGELPPDLVLLDLAMPRVDGFEVLRTLKESPKTRLTPVVVVTAFTERSLRLRAISLGADDFLSKPVDSVELRTRTRALLRLKQHIDELERLEDVLTALATIIEARDPGTGDHCVRLKRLAVAIGRDLGLSGEQLRILQLGACLHDIGKIAIPDSVLLKSGPLSADERALIETHAIVSEEILRPLQAMAPVLPLVRGHHERLDGSGYPDQLAGDAIPLEVRILSVVDVYDALTTHRPYRPALQTEEAFAILHEETGHGYWDPDVVAALVRQQRIKP